MGRGADELNNPRDERFSKLISNDLNLEEINQMRLQAEVMNAIIVNTMKRIYDNQEIHNDTIFIIGFTHRESL